jgi:hypothetical protein
LIPNPRKHNEDKGTGKGQKMTLSCALDSFSFDGSEPLLSAAAKDIVLMMS